MKKLIAVLLLALMVATVFSACGETPAESSAPAESAQTGESAEASENSAAPTDPEAQWKDADGNYVPKQDGSAFEGRTFTICVKGEGHNATYQSDDFTYGEDSSGLYGELLDDAVKERNNKIEELYKVTIVADKKDDYVTAIRNDIDSQTGTYDAIMPTLKDLAVLATEGQLVELTSIAGFDPQAPWYDQAANEAFSIKNKIYFTTGDITILNKVCTMSVIFNKDMIRTNTALADPYELVTKHEWTFDKMIEMGKAVASTNNGPSVYDNTYGLLAAYGDTFDLFGASGEKICIKNSDDVPVRSIGNSARSITLAQKILEVYAEGDDWMAFSNDRTQFTSFTDALNLFSQGKALFRVSAFSATTKLRKTSQAVFGILPTPLMDETQEEYVSYCGSSNDVAGVAIPNSAKDPAFSAFMIDACSAWAKNLITPAYVQVNLYQKDALDQESEDMLDIIFANIVYDIGECYDFGGISGVFSTLTGQRSTTIVSALDSVYGKADQEIADLVASYH